MTALKRILKGIGFFVGGLLLLAGIGYAFVAHRINGRMERRYAFAPEYLDLPTDRASLERGRHLLLIKGCNECHGGDLGGKQLADDPALGRIWGANLTRGRGGLPDDYNVQDWMAALRDGVGRGGRPLLMMPSHEYAALAEPDLAALIAYCQSLPPVDRTVPPAHVGPVAKVLTWTGSLPLLPVELIRHGAPIPKTLDTAEGPALGNYLTASCRSCHRPDLKGGDPLVPGTPPVPDITASGPSGRWSGAQFMQTLRTGRTPAGHVLNNEEMPWKMTAQYSDKELVSVYQYLRSLR